MGFGKFLATVGGGIAGFALSGGNPAGAILGAKGGADFAQRQIDERLATGVSQQQQALGQQQLQLGRDVAEQQLQAGQQAAEQFQPFQQAGGQALAERQALLGFGTPEQIAAAQGRVTDNPAFQFALQQGEKGIERAASARGRLNSGRTLLQLRDQNAQLHAGAFNQRLGQLQAPIQQGFGASQGVANALTGAAGRAGQFQTQAGAQNVAAQQTAFQSQAAANQAGGSVFDSLLEAGAVGVGAGIFGQKPDGGAANVAQSQGVAVNQSPGFMPVAPGAGQGLPGPGLNTSGFMGTRPALTAQPPIPAPGFGSPTFQGQQTGFPMRRF